MDCNNFLTTTCPNNCPNYLTCVVSCDNRKNIVCQENKKIYTLINTRKTIVNNYHIDGGVIKDNNVKKCDYLVFVVDKKVAILVELKGSQIKTALEQLNSTMDLLHENLHNCKIYARIVGSHIPAIYNTPEAIKLKKKLQKSGGQLIVKTTTFSEDEAAL